MIPYDTSMLVAPDPKWLFEKIDTSFADNAVILRKGWSSTEYDNQKQRFLRSTDMTQVILCY